MQTLRIDADTNVEFFVAGAPGPLPDLLLLHGTGGSATTNWGHLTEALTAPGRRVIAPNFAGSGGTTDAGGPLELSALARQAIEVATTVGPGPFDVAGFSLGAEVAAHLAATQPEWVRRLVLIAGWASSDDGRAPLQFDLWRHLAATDPEALAKLFTLTGFSAGFLARRPPQATAKMVADSLATMQPGVGRQAELDARIDLTPIAHDITAPTLVVGGDEDHMVPVAATQTLAALIPEARFEELHTGHLVLYEQPAALVDLINDHLA